MVEATGGVPILMYHSLSRAAAAPFRRYALDPTLFEAHLSYLAAHRYDTLTVSELTERWASGEPLSAKTVVLTFDDGFADFHTRALPALARHGMTATLYVVTGYVGDTSQWLRSEGEGDRRILSWGQLGEIAAAGIECAGHTHTHPQLDVLPAHRVHDELSRSKRLLEEQLQVPVHSFAYPFGYHCATVRATAAAVGYRSACAVAGQVSVGGDRFAIPRLTVPAGTGVDDLVRLLDQGLTSPGSRLLGRAKQLAWRGLRRHGPRALFAASAGGKPPWMTGARR